MLELIFSFSRRVPGGRMRRYRIGDYRLIYELAEKLLDLAA
jgi:mRNA-degrading endonuclease RelE of RelBE toxin-antitoxin system